ncbi:MAG: transglycosylase SLT domain-containing protein [Rubrivivax sp.]|nr:transglycosylase SLT domain-containing protein [Rubrivivax sp.]
MFKAMPLPTRLTRLLLRARAPTLALALLPAALWPVAAPARAGSGDEIVVQAREALRKKDKAALAQARGAVNAAGHPLAMWVEYWELSLRLAEAQPAELDAFFARWSGSYVEDRLRNDWLLELGRRRDWGNLRAEAPRFRMNDDREVVCYALLVQHQDGIDVRDAARAAWHAQKDLDDGCALLAKAMVDARLFTAEDVWQEARLSVEANRPRAARAAATLINAAAGQAVSDLLDNPVRYLAHRGAGAGSAGRELALLALMRLAASDPEAAAGQIEATWKDRLPLAMTATAFAHAGKQAALKQQPQAADYARRAWQLWEAAAKPGTPPPWSDDLLAWQVRAALRTSDRDKARWSLVSRATAGMSAVEQRDPAWVYWRARATQAQAKAGPEGDAARAAADMALEGIAPQLGFYGQLAAEDLALHVPLPAAPAPLTDAERQAPRGHPGLVRGLQLIALGLRGEGVREWNYSLRGLGERELLAAAQLACEREVWDRCISASERTRGEVDVALRYPLPFREALLAKARQVGLDPAVLYGLIRQESRFIADARSTVGASGLMQLMPATAKWTAKKIGLEYRDYMVNDRDTNLLLGASYLKRVLDDFGGSLAMAAAAYNAGPGRPRRWREGGTVMEPAAWIESIPFNETRDYVKKVLSNAVVYARLLGPAAAPAGTSATPLKARLGPPIGPIGPREAGAPSPDRELP